MALRDRINNLRQQTGAQATHDLPDTTLRLRLERLQARSRPGTSRPYAVQRRDDSGLAEQWGGKVISPGLILIERRLPIASAHGNTRLSNVLKPFAALREAAGFSPGQFCFFDTETSGLSGGSGTVAFLLGMGRVIGDELVIRQYQLTTFSGEQAMLQQANDWMGGAGVLVSYNGRSFDAPLLSARCRMCGMGDSWGNQPHIDLLHPTRRAFARRWSDCRLATVEQRLLDFRRADDLPGSEAPCVWQAFLQRGDSQRMPRVIEHNYRDILSLVALLASLDAVYTTPNHYNADISSLARYHLQHQAESQAKAMLEAEPALLDSEGKLLLADIYRRQARWEETEPLLMPLAEQGNIEAIERLAKYHEHQRRDYRSALRYANRLPQEKSRSQRINRLRDKLMRDTYPLDFRGSL